MRLYRDFTSQAEIDREYDAASSVPESGAIIGRWIETSAAVRDRLACRLGLKYGPTRAEYLDLFPAGPGAPLHLFFHGGYWRRFSARDFSFLAEPLVREGVAVGIVNYALCPEVTIDEIVRQARAATAWAFREARTLGCDPDRLTVSGHSAGGHLVAMLASTDWPGGYDLPADLSKAGLALSGLFDLRPFPWSYLQPSLQLSCDQVLRNSPILELPETSPPLVLAVGAAESAEFRRQSRDYHAARSARGLPSVLLEVEGAHHFSVLDALADPAHPLFARLLRLAREPGTALRDASATAST
jgi:arylformamidase